MTPNDHDTPTNADRLSLAPTQPAPAPAEAQVEGEAA